MSDRRSLQLALEVGEAGRRDPLGVLDEAVEGSPSGIRLAASSAQAVAIVPGRTPLSSRKTPPRWPPGITPPMAIKLHHVLGG